MGRIVAESASSSWSTESSRIFLVYGSADDFSGFSDCGRDDC